jgi:hypothetical protein
MMDTNYVDMNSKSNTPNDDEHEIIILDDDDFIQTTFNIFSSSSSRSINQKESADVKNENLYQNHTALIDNLNTSNTSNQQNSILIDLTTCDDFDLNDLLLMHSNNQLNLNQNNQTNSASPISNINQQDPEKTDDQKKSIKNELDFKIFNFNFGTSIEEILIDDDDEDDENEDEELEDEESASDRVNNHKHSTNLNMPSNLPNDCLQSTSFVMYRTNDSSSETSSVKQSKKTIYKCEICFKTFNKSYNYKRHLFLQHESKSSNSFSINECPNCKRRILDRSNFNKHVRICNQKTMKSKFKNSSFNIANNSDTNSNNNNNHASNNNPLSQQRITKKPLMVKKHICEICNKQFNKKFNFHRHIRMHFLNEIMNHQHDPLNYSNRTSPNIFNYNNNPSNNNVFEFYECEKCLRKFNEHKQLIQHKTKWHLTEYQCKYCIERFKEKFDFIKHLNSVHSNVKFKFECNYCKKSFKYLSQYIQHRRTHLLNNFSMINSSNNNRDQFTNDQMDVDMSTAKNDFNDITSDENNLNIKDDKFMVCEYCGRKFTKNFNLKRHIEKKHNKKWIINDSVVDKQNDQIYAINTEENNGINKIDARNVFDCNLNQKQMYKNCKINHHLNKVNLN